MDRYLRYGDVIILQASDGYVCGGTYPDRALQLFPLHDTALQYPPNLIDCRFEITRHYRYSALKVLQKKLISQGRTINSITDDIHDEDKKLNSLILEWEKEKRKNEADNLKMHGQEITFGSSIQLRHVSTGLFLTVQKMRARDEPKNRLMDLDETGNERCWLKVTLGYQAQSKGEKVRYNDDICLETVKIAQSYMHVARKETMVKYDEKVHTEIQSRYLDNRHVKGRLEVNCSTEKTRFLVKLFIPVTPKPDLREVIGGDVMVLHHYESKLAIGYDPQMMDIPLLLNAQLFRSNTCWTVQPYEVDHGGYPLKHNKSFRLKHLATQLLLAEDVENSSMVMTPNYADPNTLWTMAPFRDDEEANDSVKTVSYLYLKSPSGKFVEAKHAEQADNSRGSFFDTPIHKKFQSGTVRELSLITKCDKEDVISLTKMSNEESKHVSRSRLQLLGLRQLNTALRDVQNQSQVKDGEQDSVLLGTLPPIGAAGEETSQAPHLTPRTIERDEEVAAAVVAVVKNNFKMAHSLLTQLYATLDDDVAEPARMKAMMHWQQLLREQGVLQALVDLICLPLECGIRDHNLIERELQVTEVMKQGHRCLRRLCSNNRQNQKDLFRNVDRIMTVIEIISPTGSQFIGHFIETKMRMFWNNRTLLKRLPDGQIQRTGALLNSQHGANTCKHDAMSLLFLQSLCVSKNEGKQDGEKPVAMNQQRILEQVV